MKSIVIRVDDEVYAHLLSDRKWNESVNGVIRRKLGLSGKEDFGQNEAGERNGERKNRPA